MLFFARLLNRIRSFCQQNQRELACIEPCEPRRLLAANVLMWHNDQQLTGANLAETTLTTTNVRSTTFGKLRSLAVDGQMYAQPLYVSRLTFPKNGTTVKRNMVYVATEHDTVYAYDPDRGSLIWKARTLSQSLGETTVPAEDTGSTDLVPEIGVTSTPVIDRATQTLYVVAKSKRGTGDSAQYLFRLWAFDLITGARKFGGPVIIRARVAGSGNGSDGGNVSFLPLFEHQRPALVLLDGVIYIAFASHGDIGPYHGWLLGYSASTLHQVKAWNVTPNGSGGGIWQSGAAPAVDASGNLFLNIGNGTVDAQDDGSDFGSSFVRIPTRGGAPFAPDDFFTPFNFQNLNDEDLDLGSSGALLLPDQATGHPHQAVFGGKEGTVYLADRDDLGQFNSGSDDVLQELGPVDRGGNFSTPAYFNNRVFIGGVLNTLQSFSLRTDKLVATGQQTAEVFNYPGITPSISANGANSGILWLITRNDNRDAVLEAYSATNLAKRLYSSEQRSSRDHTGAYVKFTAPTIADGKVFVGSSNELAVYGLLAT